MTEIVEGSAHKIEVDIAEKKIPRPIWEFVKRCPTCGRGRYAYAWEEDFKK